MYKPEARATESVRATEPIVKRPAAGAGLLRNHGTIERRTKNLEGRTRNTALEY